MGLLTRGYSNNDIIIRIQWMMTNDDYDDD